MSMNHGETIYIGVGGHVVAIDTTTGEELWRTKLKRSSYVTILVRPGAIYGAASGELFCLDPATGTIRWQNRLPGLGTGIIAFGDNGPSVMASAIANDAANAAAAAAAAS
ncbi:MAG TPA: PQQ-binding-like beta-propeller repeat protein [Vicinamibacterales bacterium]|nr:PQQ-binding-like beta-propeller repeat protein [Vicinamibacterales bacterium]